MNVCDARYMNRLTATFNKPYAGHAPVLDARRDSYRRFCLNTLYSNSHRTRLFPHHLPSTRLKRDTTVHKTSETPHRPTITGCSTQTPCYHVSRRLSRYHPSAACSPMAMELNPIAPDRYSAGVQSIDIPHLQ